MPVLNVNIRSETPLHNYQHDAVRRSGSRCSGWEHSTPLMRVFPFASCCAHLSPSCGSLQLAAQKAGKGKGLWAASPALHLGHGFQDAWLAPRGKRQSQGLRSGSSAVRVSLDTVAFSLQWKQDLAQFFETAPTPPPFRAVRAPTDSVVVIMYSRRVPLSPWAPGALWSWAQCASPLLGHAPLSHWP